MLPLTSRCVVTLIGVAAIAACDRSSRVLGDTRSQQPQIERALRAYFDAFVAQDRDSIRRLTTEDFVIFENGYPVQFARFTEVWDTSRPMNQRYQLDSLQVQIVDSVALFHYALGWFVGDQEASRSIETGIARRRNGQWRFSQFHSSWLALRTPADTGALAAYSAHYAAPGDSVHVYVVYVSGGKLFLKRTDRPQWMGLRSVELIPTGKDTFALEFAGSSFRFARDATGRVIDLFRPAPDGRAEIRMARTGF